MVLSVVKIRLPNLSVCNPRLLKTTGYFFKMKSSVAKQLLVIGQSPNFPTSRTYHEQIHGAVLPLRGCNTDHNGPYSTSKNKHDGQRKLLMSEIHFLTEVYQSIDPHTMFICVYAGACPCTHLAELSQFFPYIYFVLIDPRFSEKDAIFLEARSPGKVAVCSHYFTDKTAEDIKGWMSGKNENNWVSRALKPCTQIPRKNILFISDIRSAAYDEAKIAQEMQAQVQWFKSIHAVKGLLKFRLPFITSNKQSKQLVTSLNGDVCLPVWGPPSTTECRLLVRQGCIESKYDPVKHEKLMAGFNANNRQQQFLYRNVLHESFDHFAERVILEAYHHTYLSRCRT